MVSELPQVMGPILSWILGLKCTRGLTKLHVCAAQVRQRFFFPPCKAQCHS